MKKQYRRLCSVLISRRFDLDVGQPTTGKIIVRNPVIYIFQSQMVLTILRSRILILLLGERTQISSTT